jgi:signal transduction histidine kinase
MADSLPLPGAHLPPQLLPALLDVSLAGVVYLVPRRDAAGAAIDFTLAYLNPAARRLLALPPAAGASWHRVAPAAMAGLLAFYQAAAPGDDHYETDLPYPATAPATLLRLAATRAGEGLLLSLLGPAEADGLQNQASLREQAQALAAPLQRTNEQLRRANADLDRFVHMAAHDLKAPLTNLEGLLASLRQELALPAAEADPALVLRLMQDSVRRLQHTLRYLAEAQQWQRAATAPPQAVPLAPLVAAVAHELAPLLSGGHIALAEGSCPSLFFSEPQLRGLLVQLLRNALLYRAPGRVPEVLVHCAATGRAAVLEVTDNGLGLSPGQQTQIFGMFQRQHDHVEGAGLGLYFAQQAAEQAGGRLEVSSQPGVGSTFRLVLPQ